MSIIVEVWNAGSEERPELRTRVDIQKSRPDTWYRKKVVQTSRGSSLLQPLVEIDDCRQDLHDLAQAAFELGRSTERAINEGILFAPAILTS